MFVWYNFLLVCCWYICLLSILRSKTKRICWWMVLCSSKHLNLSLLNNIWSTDRFLPPGITVDASLFQSPELFTDFCRKRTKKFYYFYFFYKSPRNFFFFFFWQSLHFNCEICSSYSGVSDIKLVWGEGMHILLHHSHSLLDTVGVCPGGRDLINTGKPRKENC